MKSNAQHFRRAARAKKQRTVDLAGQKTSRLAAPFTSVESFKRLAPVENKLWMAVGDHALRRGVVAIVLQNPETVDERPQPGRRPDFSITNHPRMIARG